MDDEILEEFLLESVEALDALDVELVDLEQDPSSTALLSSIFRRVHTIKGTCGFLGFATLEKVSHVGENLLSKLRDGDLQVSGPITTGLLEMNDALRELLDQIQDTGHEGSGDYTALTERLTRLASGEPVAAEDPAPADEPANPVDAPAVAPLTGVEVVAVAPQPPPESGPAPLAADASSAEAEATPESEAATEPEPEPARATPAATTAGDSLDRIDVPANVRLGDLLLSSGRISRVQLEAALRRQSNGDPRRLGEILLEMGAITSEDVVATLAAQSDVRAVGDSSIRVDVSILDRLMNLVGELVLARNQILQVSQQSDDATLSATCQRLDHITTELQGGVMQTRMQPIENAWSKFPRIVRDLARSLGKEVRLEMVGQDTELDKSLLEAIRDPLTHLVRNAVDHGLEEPTDRLVRGKAEQGTLTLKAYHEGGQVNIEVSDDGKGMDLERVRVKAVEKELVSAERASRLSQRELIDLIFTPGFSTAAAVTNISGRGVGMDVVKTNIEKIGGSVDMQTRIGLGTTVRVRIPLTLAIIPALVVSDGGEHYAIPQVNLLELVRLDPNDVRQVEWLDGVPVHRLRGALLPLVFLHETLGHERAPSDGMNVIVLQAGERQFGLVVDAINDSAEIVVKPLGSALRDVTLFAGATIMGDGRVALILDVNGLAENAGLRLDGQDRMGFGDADDDHPTETRALLVFTLTGERRFAVPLDAVTRLEEVAHDALERSGNHTVIQYRNEIMPVVELAGILERDERAPQQDPDRPLQIIVHRDEHQAIGLAVGRIIDIVEQDMDVVRPLDLPGLWGSAVIQGQVTDIVDVEGLQRLTGLDRVPTHSR